MIANIDTTQIPQFIFSVKGLTEKMSKGMGLIDIVDYHFTLFRLKLKFRKIRKELEEMFSLMKTNPQVLNSPKTLPFYSNLNENIAEMLEVVSENEKLANTSLLNELNKLKRISYSSEAYLRRHSVKQS
jgi:hypothetical protein